MPRTIFFKDPEFLRPHTMAMFAALLSLIGTYLRPIVTFEVLHPNGPATLRLSAAGYDATGSLEGAAVLPELLPAWILGGLLFLGVLFSLLTLTRYSDRAQMQRMAKITTAFYLLIALGNAAAAYFTNQVLKSEGYSVDSYSLDLGAFLPALAVVLGFGAMASIKRDIHKLRSADRFW
jgi:hypothetical protein